MKKIALATLIGLSTSFVAQATETLSGVSHQSPYCGCCGKWVEHLEENGIKLTTQYDDNLVKIKQESGLTPGLTSCHTAKINGYAFEGHVPADDIKRFLANPPKGAKGLTVPNMPVGSPGMEYNNQQDPYQVLTFDGTGKTQVWASYPQ